MRKYRNKPVEIDGHRFDSKKEGNRYTNLKLLQRGKVISGLELQPKFPLEINGQKICTYIADFRYQKDGEVIIEDVKGVKTPVYKLKKKLMKAIHNIEIQEV